MKYLAATLGIAFLACGAAAASEEEFLSAHKVTITEDGSKVTVTADGSQGRFGKVSAILQTTKDGTDRIMSIILTVDGKELVVPKEQFDDLRDPLAKTAEFRWEAGRGSGPWLYLTFQLARQEAKPDSERQRVYIRYQNGKLMDRSIRQPQR